MVIIPPKEGRAIEDQAIELEPGAEEADEEVKQLQATVVVASETLTANIALQAEHVEEQNDGNGIEAEHYV